MKEKIPEELRKEFEQAVLNADLDYWIVDNDRQFLDKIWDAVDKLFNQEVERRIKERMLSDEDIIDFALLYVSHKSLLPANKGLIKDAIIIGMKEVRSRLTNPNNNPK